MTPLVADCVVRAMEEHHICAADVAAQTGVAPSVLALWLQQRQQQPPGPRHQQYHLITQRMERWLERIAKRAIVRRGRGVARTVYDAAQTELIPIRLELTVLQEPLHKTSSGVASFSDSFLWSPSSSLSPRAFLTQTLRDLNMEAYLWLDRLEASMLQQIQAHRQDTPQDNTAGPQIETQQQHKPEQPSQQDVEMVEEKSSEAPPHAAGASVASSAGSAAEAATADPAAASSSVTSVVSSSGGNSNGVEEAKESDEHGPRLIRLELDIVHNSMRLQDVILWDPSNPYADPDTFAHHYARDQGLPTEFAVKAAWAIREQLAVATATVPLPTTTEQLFRSPEDSVEFTPIVRPLTVRHHIAVSQRPPPPYIAQYIPSTHRHAVYLGEVIDGRLIAPPAPAPAPTHTTAPAPAPPVLTPALAPPPPAPTRLTYAFGRMLEDEGRIRIRLLKHRTPVAESGPALAAASASFMRKASASRSLRRSASSSARRNKRRRSNVTSDQPPAKRAALALPSPAAALLPGTSDQVEEEHVHTGIVEEGDDDSEEEDEEADD